MHEHVDQVDGEDPFDRDLAADHRHVHGVPCLVESDEPPGGVAGKVRHGVPGEAVRRWQHPGGDRLVLVVHVADEVQHVPARTGGRCGP
ncbi:hypothetical protein GCM10028793_19200 [Nocardiopsis oceani]